MKIIIGWGIIIFFLLGCQPTTNYERMVKKGLESGIREDSLFMGLYFGMTRKDFLDHCWKMNKKGIFMNGHHGISVQYDVTNELSRPGKIYFYPDFQQDKIFEMPVIFEYDSFAWRPEALDTLLLDAKQMLTRWYGEFVEIKNPEKGSVWVNVNGNRQIRLLKTNFDTQVRAIFTDLTVEKK